MTSLRRRFALTVLASCLSVGVLASSSVFAQEAGEEPPAGEAIVAEMLEFVPEEAPVIDFVEPAPETIEFIEPAPEAVEPEVIAAAPEIIVPTPAPTVAPLPTPTAVPQPTATPAPAAGKLTVAVIDNRFQPTALNITPGTTVTWTNNGNNIHTLTSAEGLFDSGGLLGGDSFSFTFDKSGTYRLICRQHGLNGMFGSIVVQ